MRATKIALLAGISGLALQLAAPDAFAADMAMKAPPAAPAPAGVWTWWVEGGAAGMGGDPYIFGFTTPAFDLLPKRWGGQGAIGVDYRFAASPWHLSADFRYMQFGSNSGGGPETAIFSPGPFPGPAAIVGNNSASRKEHNWEADFMVGRDLGIGSPAQLKVGLRVADIWGQTTGVANWAYVIITPPPGGAVTQMRSYQQTNKWLGVGPRAAIEGSVPLQGAWSLDYNGGIAGLFGHMSGNQNVSIVSTGPAVLCLSGCPRTISTSANSGVFNADAQAGFAYAFSPAAKLSVNYRVEYFRNAMATFNSSNTGTLVSRYDQGPTLKLTVAY